MDITRLGGFLLEAHPGLRRVFWRLAISIWRHGILTGTGRLHDYGLAVSDDDPDRLQLFPMDEPDRLGIQLYHRVASARVRGLEVLEVGCGRGGGASYNARHLAPRRVVGLDVASGMIAFCRHRHRAPGLVFYVRGALSV